MFTTSSCNVHVYDVANAEAPRLTFTGPCSKRRQEPFDHTYILPMMTDANSLLCISGGSPHPSP